MPLLLVVYQMGAFLYMGGESIQGLLLGCLSVAFENKYGVFPVTRNADAHLVPRKPPAFLSVRPFLYIALPYLYECLVNPDLSSKQDAVLYSIDQQEQLSY